MNKFEHYKTLAEIFRYPNENLGGRMEEFQSLVSEQFPEKMESISTGLDTFNNMSVPKQQEYYLKTFDVQASCHLDIGYVVFGDDAKRGRFLYHIKEEQEKAANECGKDLADFLPNILTLLPKLDNVALDVFIFKLTLLSTSLL